MIPISQWVPGARVIVRGSAGCGGSMIDCSVDGDGVLIPVKAVPGASRTEIVGEWDGRLKIVVAAPPEKGKANQAIANLLAERLGVRRRDVSVVRGHTTPLKTIRIEGARLDAVRAALEHPRS